MSFNAQGGASGAMMGAKAGAAFGWPGMVIGGLGGGLLGGFLGGDDPEEYGAQQYAQDIAPYQQQVDQYRDTSVSMMNPNSSINRAFTQNTMNNAMDMMGTSNIINQRNNASNPYINTSGINQAQNQMSMLKYANMGLQNVNQGLQQRFNTGFQGMNTAMQHQGDISMGLADLQAGNVGQRNMYNQMQSNQMFSSMGQFGGALQGLVPKKG